eukprot:313683-Rhodomonas_salina.1
MHASEGGYSGLPCMLVTEVHCTLLSHPSPPLSPSLSPLLFCSPTSLPAATTDDGSVWANVCNPRDSQISPLFGVPGYDDPIQPTRGGSGVWSRYLPLR